MTTHANNLDTSHKFDAYPAYRRLVSGSSENRQMDIYLVCQKPSEAQKVFGLKSEIEALSESELDTLVRCVATSSYASWLATRGSSFDMLSEEHKTALVDAVEGRTPSFGDTGTNLRVQLGGDDPYFRYWNDEDLGGVWNTPTFNRYGEKIAGGFTGYRSEFPIFSAQEASALLEKGRKIAQELFENGVGAKFEINYSASEKKVKVTVV